MSCSGLTGVVSQVSPGLHGRPEAGARKANSGKLMPVANGQGRNDRGTKRSDCRIGSECSVETANSGREARWGGSGRPNQVMDRKKRGPLDD